MCHPSDSNRNVTVWSADCRQARVAVVREQPQLEGSRGQRARDPERAGARRCRDNVGCLPNNPAMIPQPSRAAAELRAFQPRPQLDPTGMTEWNAWGWDVERCV